MRAPFSILNDADDSLIAGRVESLAASCLRRVLETCPTVLTDGVPGRLLDSALCGIGAHEGSLWLATAEADELLPVWNNGPEAERFVGSFKLPAARGITGMVFSTSLSACESEVCFHQRHDRTLDEALEVLTWAMLAVPVHLLNEVRGVITAVRLVRRSELPAAAVLPRSRAEWPADVPVPASFGLEQLSAMEHTAAVLGRLLEHRLQTWALGGED